MPIARMRNRIQTWRRMVSKRLWTWRHGRVQSSRAVFILGAQRSGTSMLANSLGESPEFEVYGEKSIAFEDNILKDADTVRRLLQHSSHPFVVFKPLTDSHRAAALLSIKHGSKAIWMYRRPEDRASSAVEKFGDTNLRFLQELGCQGPTDRWEARGITRETLTIVRRLNPDSMNAHTAAATFWYLRNQLFFDQNLDRNRDVLLLRYEELVTAPEVAMRILCSFIGCQFHPRMIVNIHQRSVGRSDVHLPQEVAEACRTMLDRLDKCFDEQRTHWLTG